MAKCEVYPGAGRHPARVMPGTSRLAVLAVAALLGACTTDQSETSAPPVPDSQATTSSTFAPCSPEAVIFIQDAAIDELLASVLLMQAHQSGQIRYVGEIITDGDTLITAGMDVMHRIRRLLGVTDVPLTASSVRAVHPFPYSYRGDSLKALDLDILAGLGEAPYPYADGDAALIDWLGKSDCAMTLAVVGPLTPLAQALRARPDLESRIGRVVWMGGAIDVEGNVAEGLPEPLLTPCAEWNAFWDAEAVEFIFEQTGIPVTEFGLDATPESAKVQPFLAAAQEVDDPGKALQMAVEFYGLVVDEKFYRLWDTVAVGSLLNPSLYWEPTEVRLEVNTSLVAGKYGCLSRSQSGRPVQAMLGPPDTFVPGFISYYIDRLQAFDN